MLTSKDGELDKLTSTLAEKDLEIKKLADHISQQKALLSTSSSELKQAN
jgi:hypothetical protein